MTVSPHLSAAIRVAAFIPAKAGAEDKMIAGLKDLVTVSNTQDGVLEYQLTQDVKDSTKFWMIESYKDKASLDGHMASDVFKEAGPKLADALGGELVLNWLTPVPSDTHPVNLTQHTSGGLRVLALIVAKAGNEEDLKAGLSGLIKATHQEQGVLEYQLTQDSTNPTKFWMVETYTDSAAFDAHTSSEHFKAVGGVIGGFLAAPLEIHVLKPIQY